jgi:hypothetical protein
VDKERFQYAIYVYELGWVLFCVNACITFQ